jgi:signal transduction histidine kinase
MHDDEGRQRFMEVSELVGARLSEIQLTIDFVQNRRMEIALSIFDSDAGKKIMDQLRMKVSTLEKREQEQTVEINKSWDSTLRFSRSDIVALSFINILLFAALFRWLDRHQRREYAERNLMRARHGELNTLIRQRTLQLENLASTLQQVSEVEKSRLARELHDELGAILTATRMDVLWVRQHLPPEQHALSEKLMQAMANLEQGIHIKRRIIEDLRPTILVTLGFVTAARELAEQTAARAGWELDLKLPDEIPTLREDISIALFRILQESLTNAAKYARATRVTIGLTCRDGLVRLEIRDNGVGFLQQDFTTPTHGLLGMRQRVVAFGGRFEISSSPGKGTWVQVGVLLEGGSPAGDAVSSTELLSL